MLRMWQVFIMLHAYKVRLHATVVWIATSKRFPHLAYMVQSSDMPTSSVDGCKFVLASNEDGHGNHVVI